MMFFSMGIGILNGSNMTIVMKSKSWKKSYEKLIIKNSLFNNKFEDNIT